LAQNREAENSKNTYASIQSFTEENGKLIKKSNGNFTAAAYINGKAARISSPH